MPRTPRPRPQDSDVQGSCQFGGLYAIENVITYESYVGSTVNMRKRWHLHRTLLRSGKHHAKKLQAAWVKYGEECFRFMPLCVIEDKAQRVAMEQHFLTSLRPSYNTSPTATSCAGVKRSTETIAKIRAAVTAPARLEKLRVMGKKPKSAEHRARIAASHQGLRPTEETRAKLRAASARRWGRA